MPGHGIHAGLLHVSEHENPFYLQVGTLEVDLHAGVPQERAHRLLDPGGRLVRGQPVDFDVGEGQARPSRLVDRRRHLLLAGSSSNDDFQDIAGLNPCLRVQLHLVGVHIPSGQDGKRCSGGTDGGRRQRRLCRIPAPERPRRGDQNEHETYETTQVLHGLIVRWEHGFAVTSRPRVRPLPRYGTAWLRSSRGLWALLTRRCPH